MPHLTIEYSANLDGEIEFGSFCRAMSEEMMAVGLFERGAIRVRAIRCDAYAVADLLPENAFIDMSLRIGAGRSLAEKKHAGKSVFQAAAAHLAKRLEQPHFALSLEIREINPELSWKRNSMHLRVRKQV